MPSIPANLDWLFLAIGALLALSSLFLLFWSLFRDRARAAFRCPRCWYDLTPPDGAPPPLPITCSECGRTITKPRDLRKRRRKWRYALLALLLLPPAGAIAYYPTAQRNGWLTIVPTRVLIDTMPIFGYPTPLTDELARRCGIMPKGQQVQSGPPTIHESDYEYLVHRIAQGNQFARPISPQWKRTFGAFQRHFQPRLFNADFEPGPLLGQLYELPPEIILKTRSVWPEGVPLYVQTTATTWWPSSGDNRIRVRCGGDNSRWHDLAAPDGFIIDDAAPRDGEMFGFDVELSHFAGNEGEVEKTVLTRFARQIRIHGSIDEAITPVSDPGIDALVRAISITAGNRRWRIDHESTCVPLTRGMAFGVFVDFLLDGELQATRRMWWIGGAVDRRSDADGLRWDWVRDPRSNAGDRRGPYDAQPGENWTVRIRSDPETALRVIDADRYWQGDVTIPLTIR